jgi:hypothetical protein
MEISTLTAIEKSMPSVLCSKVKVMLIVFFDYKGLVHHKYAPQGQHFSSQVFKSI